MTIGLVMALGVALVEPGTATAASISTSAKKAFIASVVAPAQKAQRDFGVPASVSIAQAIEDSDWGTSKPAEEARNYFNTRCSAGMTAGQFASLADAQVGKPYLLGAEASLTNTDPRKFDCSELVEWLFGRSGNPITDLAAAQYNVTKAVGKGNSPKVGDLVFLRNNPARSNGIGHVAVLTKKLSNGDWRIVEARGRAYGVVRTTLSYWKTRKYYAGLRRYAKLVFAGSDGVTTSAASRYQTGCLTISGTRYAKFSTVTNSFLAHAIAVTQDSAYKSVRSVLGSVPKYIEAIAKVEHPKDAADYADRIEQIMDAYDLRDYDVVPFDLVLLSGAKGAKVTATQHLLSAAGQSVKLTGKYDSATVSAVKKFQKAKKLEVDGEAGPITLTALMKKLAPGAKGDEVNAVHAMLSANGYQTNPGASFGSATEDSVKAFQAVAGRTPSGVVDNGTWAALFMTLDPAPTPRITGTAEVGQTLTAGPGSWGPGSVSLAYQWYRDDKAISGATKATYKLGVEDAGYAMRVRVTGTKVKYTQTARISAATAAVPLLKLTTTPAPKVTGNAEVGQTLTAAPGTWAPEGIDLAYQWYRGDKAIGGATKATYTVDVADAGARLRVAVTGTKTGYRAVTKTSSQTSAVPNTLIAPTPEITGELAVGNTLTAEPGKWEPGKVSLAYQWYRDSAAIKGATKATYPLQAADAGAKLKVRVTGSQEGFTTTSKTSAATETVAKGTLVEQKISIKGTRRAGKTLTAIRGTWGPGSVTYSYQWYRSDKAIKGADAKSYRLVTADKGKTVSVRIRVSKAGYTTVSAKTGVKIAK